MKPFLLISNDWHLKEDNSYSIKDLVLQKISVAKSHNINEVRVLGDVFDSRPAQKQSNLCNLDYILDIFHENGIKAIIVAGNHEKVSYTSDESYLKPYRNHPAVTLIDTPTYEEKDGIGIYSVPFYEDSTWLEKFTLLMEENPIRCRKNILLSHRAFDGSTDNDGIKIEGSISTDTVNMFDMVFLGHYHDMQTVGDNILHCPSIQQNNFGEDSNKGFTLVYDDLSYEVVKSKFREYKTIEFNADISTQKDLTEIVMNNNGKSNVRVMFRGEKKNISSLNTSVLKEAGIKFDKKETEEETRDTEFLEKIVKIDDDTVGTEYKAFCEDNGTDYVNSVKYLR